MYGIPGLAPHSNQAIRGYKTHASSRNRWIMTSAVYSGLVALHKNGLANTEIRMYGDERLPFEAGGSAMLNFIDGHKKFEERYTIIYRGPSKKPAPKIEKETRQVRKHMLNTLSTTIGLYHVLLFFYGMREWSCSTLMAWNM